MGGCRVGLSGFLTGMRLPHSRADQRQTVGILQCIASANGLAEDTRCRLSFQAYRSSDGLASARMMWDYCLVGAVGMNPCRTAHRAQALVV